MYLLNFSHAVKTVLRKKIDDILNAVSSKMFRTWSILVATQKQHKRQQR